MSSSTDEAKHELVRAWLHRADHDLKSARRLAEDPEPLLDTAVYHCQQAAEKAIKGFLVFHDQRFAKTHDLEVLLALAVPFEQRLSVLIGPAERLTGYATASRYPGAELEPDRAEFDEALHDAEAVYGAVLHALPASVHP